MWILERYSYCEDIVFGGIRWRRDTNLLLCLLKSLQETKEHWVPLFVCVSDSWFSFYTCSKHFHYFFRNTLGQCLALSSYIINILGNEYILLFTETKAYKIKAKFMFLFWPFGKMKACLHAKLPLFILFLFCLSSLPKPQFPLFLIILNKKDLQLFLGVSNFFQLLKS